MAIQETRNQRVTLPTDGFPSINQSRSAREVTPPTEHHHSHGAHHHEADAFDSEQAPAAVIREGSSSSTTPTASTSSSQGLGPGIAVTEAVATLATGPAVHVDVRDLTPAERQAIVNLYRPFGEGMIEMHEAWHQANGSGGTRGEGSGERFMQFHENLMIDFLRLLETQEPELFARLGGQLPSWDTTGPLPSEFEFPGMNPNIVGNPNGINWPIPSYLTVEGGSQSYTLNDGGPDTPRVIRSLADIRNPDELGRVLGASGAHAVGHNRLGGGMASFASVAEPPFLLWHGKMVEIQEAWTTTEAGQAWLAEHPSGWTDPDANGHDHSGMDMDMPMPAAATERAAQPTFTDADFAAELARLAAQQNPSGGND
jgi:hypothetical protein